MFCIQESSWGGQNLFSMKIMSFYILKGGVDLWEKESLYTVFLGIYFTLDLIITERMECTDVHVQEIPPHWSSNLFI